MIWKLLPSLFLLFLALTAALAQSGRKPQRPPGQPEKPGQLPGEKPILKLETREVVITLNAFDAGGKFVNDLTTKDVIVLEEGEPRIVSSIKREQANIVLVLDLSNEIGTFKNGPTRRVELEGKSIWEIGKNYQVIPRPTTRIFADNFVSRLSPDDQISIIQYSDRVQVMQDWTSDHKKALESLSSKYRVGIKASFHDAIRLAVDKLESRKKGRPVIVLVSDGLDSNSRSTREEALGALAKSRASVFVIGWGEALKKEIEFAANWSSVHDAPHSSNKKRIAELRRHLPQLDAAEIDLRNIAEATGGLIWLPPTHEQLISTWNPLAAEIGSQYSLSFITERKPSLEDNRSIEVIVARAGVSVRSRRSYYVGDDYKSSN
jgi:VWFA-related protein